MADPVNILVHLKSDAERQRHLARMQRLRNGTAASHMLKVAATLQGGVALNATKGVAPFMAANSTRGMGTVATGGTVLASAMIFTPVQPTPRRRRRGRR